MSSHRLWAISPGLFRPLQGNRLCANVATQNGITLTGDRGCSCVITSERTDVPPLCTSQLRSCRRRFPDTGNVDYSSHCRKRGGGRGEGKKPGDVRENEWEAYMGCPCDVSATLIQVEISRAELEQFVIIQLIPAFTSIFLDEH